MPIPYEVTEYGCAYKCGHKHTKSLSFIEAHEVRCWHNPVNRTCCTCKHGSIEYDSDDVSAWKYRVCALDIDVDFGINPPLPVVNCEKWEERI